MIFSDQPDPSTLLVLRCIWLNPLISRSDISRIVSLDQSTISRIVANLLETGIVQVSNEGQSGPQGGRRPVYLKINPKFGCVVGIELSSESYNLVGINLVGEILFSTLAKHSVGDSGIMGLYQTALAHARKLVADINLPLLGVGLGLPGIIDSRNGVILQSFPLEISKPLDFIAALPTDVPVRIEHDARCCCWAELIFHQGRCSPDFLCVLGEFRRNRIVNQEFQGIALGLGMVLNNHVHTGQNNSAGEFRSVFYDGASKNHLFGIPDHDLVHLESSTVIQDQFARELGRNLALIVNVLNVSQLFICGSIERLGARLLAAIEREVHQNWTYSHQGEFHVAYTALGENAVAYGAAAMFFELIFAPPDSNPTINKLIVQA